jgi:hypothetical protein
MPQDIPSALFLEQIGNPALRSVLTGANSLPDLIGPTALLLSLAQAMNKAQVIFNQENNTLPNIATVSAREMGPTTVTPEGSLQAQLFFTIGGNLTFDVDNVNPIIF